MDQGHARHYCGCGVIRRGPGQPVLQQRMDNRRALQQCHSVAKAGQHKGVLPQAGSGVQDVQRLVGAFQTNGLGDELTGATAMGQAISGLAGHKLRPDRSRCLASCGL